MANNLGINVKPMGFRIALIGLLALLLVAILANFKVADFSNQTTNILTLTAAMFVLVEASVISVLKHSIQKKKVPDVVSMVSIIIGLLALIGFFLGIFGISNTILSAYNGIVLSVLFIMVFVEAVKK